MAISNSVIFFRIQWRRTGGLAGSILEDVFVRTWRLTIEDSGWGWGRGNKWRRTVA